MASPRREDASPKSRQVAPSAAVATDVAVGIAAGLVGTLAMKGFQSVWVNVTESAPKGRAAEEAANAVSEAISGKPVRHGAMKAAIDAVCYGAGAIMGGTYGLVAGLFPLVTIGGGALYGGILWLAADGVANPALGLAPPPTKTSAQEHGYGLASYLVFAVALDLTRRTLNRWISPYR
jgi:hypothetical protein